MILGLLKARIMEIGLLVGGPLARVAAVRHALVAHLVSGFPQKDSMLLASDFISPDGNRTTDSDASLRSLAFPPPWFPGWRPNRKVACRNYDPFRAHVAVAKLPAGDAR